MSAAQLACLIARGRLSKLSLPSGKVASVSLSDNLSGDIRTMVGDIENHLLQDASLWTDIELEASQIKTYNGLLLSTRRGYLDFLKHLFKCGFCSSRIPVEVWLLLFCA